jgi:hypothetical protein
MPVVESSQSMTSSPRTARLVAVWEEKWPVSCSRFSWALLRLVDLDEPSVRKNCSGFNWLNHLFEFCDC